MRYTVIWLPLAIQQLAAVWNASADRNGVTAASERLDRRLAADPHNEGESRDDADRRVAFEAPLRLFYRVFPDLGEVHVYSVSAFGRRG